MNKRKICIIFIFIVLLSTLTGCGKLKNERAMIRHIENKYNIDVKIINTEKEEDKITYTIQNKDTNTIFTASSFFEDFSIDGSTMFTYATTRDNYYKKLTEQLSEQINNIENKYQIKFDAEYSNLINKIIFPTDKINFETSEAAVKEINKLYNFKKELNYSDSRVYICINNPDNPTSLQYTKYYYEYTIKGKPVTLHDEEEEFYQNNNIPKELDQDIIDFVNKKHHVDCEIDNIQMIPYYDYDEKKHYYDRIISYILLDKESQFKIEYRIDLYKYRNDLENNAIDNMELYIDTYIEYVYN